MAHKVERPRSPVWGGIAAPTAMLEHSQRPQWDTQPVPKTLCASQPWAMVQGGLGQAWGHLPGLHLPPHGVTLAHLLSSEAHCNGWDMASRWGGPRLLGGHRVCGSCHRGLGLTGLIPALSPQWCHHSFCLCTPLLSTAWVCVPGVTPTCPLCVPRLWCPRLPNVAVHVPCMPVPSCVPRVCCALSPT